MATEYTIDGTPEKHIFRGMIADYDLQTGLCELLDNALDFWAASKRKSKLKIEVGLDVTRQIVTVRDNAGGVKEGDLRLLVAPGASRETASENLVGIFGVGGKRAGVALGELVEIRTRYRTDKSLKIRIDDEWLQNESWDIDYAECAAIGVGCTVVEVSKNWDEDVFAYPIGSMQDVDPTEIADGAKLILPKLPRGRRASYLEQARKLNARKSAVRSASRIASITGSSGPSFGFATGFVRV